jgi:hypothetical protein
VGYRRPRLEGIAFIVEFEQHLQVALATLRELVGCRGGGRNDLAVPERLDDLDALLRVASAGRPNPGTNALFAQAIERDRGDELDAEEVRSRAKSSAHTLDRPSKDRSRRTPGYSRGYLLPGSRTIAGQCHSVRRLPGPRFRRPPTPP